MTEPCPGYDLIGDIHGHYEALCSLLNQLGYEKKQQLYLHPEGRRLIFVGDLIDRGPQIAEVLYLVRHLLEAEAAFCVMGNHEYNALAYHTWLAEGTEGHFLRAHSPKNTRQLAASLAAFASNPGEWLEHLAWLHKLPLFLELPGLRVVHACWDASWIEWFKNLSSLGELTPALLYASSQAGSAAWQAIESLLKGWEVTLPQGLSYLDAEGHPRTESRLRWWPQSGDSWRDWLVSSGSLEQELAQIPFAARLPAELYPADAPPVFFGHYWLRGRPRLQAANVCCLDYSIAKGGKLVAYRWSGEQTLSTENLYASA